MPIARTSVAVKNRDPLIADLKIQYTMNNRRFVEKTSWLRPYTRWATRFSLNAPQWLPAVIRNSPLRLSSWVLRCYHLAMR